MPAGCHPPPRRGAGGGVAFAALALFIAATPVAADPVQEALRERIEFERETGALRISGAEIVGTPALPMLYGDVDFRPLWRDPARVRELMALVQESYDDGLSPVDYHLTALARAWPVVQTNPTRDNVADFDILATDAYMLLLFHTYFGKTDPVSLEPTWNFSTRSITGQQAVEFVVDAIRGNRLRVAIEAVRPAHWMYQRGREVLRAYREIAARGGWPALPPGETLKPGMTDARIPALRRRLVASGDLRDGGLDARSFDPPLEAAVRNFQERHRLAADGVVGAATLAELNVPVESRIGQIRVNLERGRHVLHEIGDGDLVVVDIAGFELRYLHDRKTVWTSRVQVGQAYRQTPIFKASIEHIVLNPAWTVPPGILQKDVLPAVRRDPGYLARRGLEVFDLSGRRVDASSVDWSRYSGSSVPYLFRQSPGADNALGRVKIMFPNQHLVYLHDTPSRALFARDDRAFSSGCIRVERPLELVERLLGDPAWTVATLQSAIDAGQTHTIRPARPVPVLLIYWTVDEDDQGRVVFKRDVYGRDAPLAAALAGRSYIRQRFDDLRTPG